MRVEAAVIFAMVAVPGAAAADGWFVETQLGRSVLGDGLAEHVTPDNRPGDGGLMGFGWGPGRWQVGAVLMVHDVITRNGEHDDNFIMVGLDLRHHTELASHLDLALRGGIFHAGIYGPGESPLEQYRGGGVRAGAGLRFRTFTCEDLTFSITAGVVRNQVWLSSDGAKDLESGSWHFLLGIDYDQAPSVGRRCVW